MRVTMAHLTFSGPTAVNLGDRVAYRGTLYPDEPLQDINDRLGLWVDEVFWSKMDINLLTNAFLFAYQWNVPGTHNLTAIWQGPPTVRANGTYDDAYRFTVLNIKPPDFIVARSGGLVASRYGSKYAFTVRNPDLPS